MNFYDYLKETNFTNKLGKGVKVAIIDSGCNSHLPNIVGKYNGFDRNDNISDETGHGTAISHIVYEIVPNCELYICKSLINNVASMESVYNCLSYIYANDIDVVCMSFAGMSNFSVTTLRALRDCQKNGTMFFASVGNDNQNTIVFPAHIEGVMAVGGVSKDDINAKASMANYAPGINFVALAEDVQTQYDAIARSGTSFSNAIVMSQVAYILSANNLRAKDVNYDYFKKYFKKENYDTDIAYGNLYYEEKERNNGISINAETTRYHWF